jgi:2-C-methyl-D-erythritol 4-phosphate cytidylyltransferase
VKHYALIVAGGSGTRMGSEIPKQFLLLNTIPILMHTLRAFHQAGCELIVVLPESQIAYWKKLCDVHTFEIQHKLVLGGPTRFYSVKNGLSEIAENSLVAIHDGVRPCISQKTIQHSFEIATAKGNAIVAVKPKDSIRVITDEHDNQSVNRDYYRLVQTPQTFLTNEIKKAYAQATNDNFSDDASVYEAAGYSIQLIEGDYRNIKITTPEDLKLAEVLIKD